MEVSLSVDSDVDDLKAMVHERAKTTFFVTPISRICLFGRLGQP
jgi:hypothetical protein